MKKSILLLMLAAFNFLSGQENITNATKGKMTSKTSVQKDTEAIKAIYVKMTDGFKVDDLSGFYNALHENAIVIDGDGNEIYDKVNIVNHFKTRLATKDIKLTGWKLYELIISENLALSKAKYQMTYLENGEVVGNSNANWHIVWKKNTSGTWQILREIFSERED